jgi:hypothetical protein
MAWYLVLIVVAWDKISTEKTDVSFLNIHKGTGCRDSPSATNSR